MQSSGAVADGQSPRELREVLDAGLDKLSERYRLPLVLHYLEGHSQDEVGALLNVPSGTLASLLSRGRDLLREQLGRQGVMIGAIPLCTLLDSGLHVTAMPSGFTATTVAAAGAVASGGAVLVSGASHQAAALAHASWASMAKAKLMIVAAALIVGLGGVAGTASYLLFQKPLEDNLGATRIGLAAAPAAAARVVPAPAAPGAAVASAEDGAVMAVRALVHALRANDLVALFRLASPAQQAHALAAWTKEAKAPLGDPAIVDAVLSVAASDAGRQQALPLVEAVIGHLPVAQWLQQTHSRLAAVRAASPSAAAGDQAERILFAQQQMLVALVDAGSAWLATARLEDPLLATTAARHVLDGLAELHIAHTAELTQLELPEALARLGAFVAQLKLACGAYGLEIDRVLDSARIQAVGPGPQDTARRVVEVTMTAFGTPFTLPLEVVCSGSSWSIVPAGSVRVSGAQASAF